jgi:DSF synthase
LGAAPEPNAADFIMYLDVTEAYGAPPSACALQQQTARQASRARFLATVYQDMAVEFDEVRKAAWMLFQPAESLSFTPALLADLLRFERELTRFMASPGPAQPVHYVVTASKLPGVYNLGGDLAHFAACIRAGNREALRAYAHQCCQMVHHGATAFDLPVVLIGLVQGDALGGGFECAMSCPVVIAERKARFGMPEVLFNMFPGMGAYSLLSRRVGPIQAERMITSGRIYTAEEMRDLGLVDIVCDDGEGVAAVHDYIARTSKQFGMVQALHDVRRKVNPLTLQELLDVTDRWVDLAMQLDEASLRRMEKLRAAQARRMAQASASRAA